MAVPFFVTCSLKRDINIYLLYLHFTYTFNGRCAQTSLFYWVFECRKRDLNIFDVPIFQGFADSITYFLLTLDRIIKVGAHILKNFKSVLLLSKRICIGVESGSNIGMS